MRAICLGLVLVFAAASPAQADDKAKAKAAYEQGLKHYNLSEWPEAIKSWKEAYLLSKKPLLLFNIGQAYRLSGDCKGAMNFYDSYQREEPNPKNQDELDQALAMCKDKPAEKPVVVKPAEKPVIVKPADKPVVVKPAEKPPEVVAQKPEEPQPQEEPVDEPEPTTTGGGLRKVGIGVGALGVVLGGLGVYFALDSGSKADELDGHTGEWTQDEVDLEASGKSAATRAWIFGGVGIAAIAAGSVLFVIGGPKATAEASSVSIVPTRGGAQVGWAFRF